MVNAADTGQLNIRGVSHNTLFMGTAVALTLEFRTTTA